MTDSQAVDGRGRFVFRADGGGGAARSLEPLVAGHAIDPRALAAAALALPPTRVDETPYRGIRAEWRAAEATFEPPPRFADAEAAVVGVRRALDDAVARALDGASRVAVLTGGGLDSASLLALVVRWARRTGKSAFAVALDFEAPGDDRPHLAAVEAHLGCEVLRVRPEDAAPRMQLFWTGVDATPFTWCTGAFEVEMLARARANGADCAVSGVGGDELFDGEPRSLARIARGGSPLAAVATARRMRGFDEPNGRVLTWIVRPLVTSLVPRTLRAYRAERARATPPPWAGPTLRAVVAEDARRAGARVRSRSSSSDPSTRFDDATTRPHHLNIAWLRHQEEIATGVSRRDPYLDLQLVRTVTSLPAEWLVHGARRRGLLRDALGELLPPSARERMDKAEFEPAIERFVAAAGGLSALAPLATGERLADLGVVEPRTFGEVVRSFLARPRGEDWVSIWPALACEAFLRSRERSAS